MGQWVDQHRETLLLVFVGFIHIFPVSVTPVPVPTDSGFVITSVHMVLYAHYSVQVTRSLHLTARIPHPPTPHPSHPCLSQSRFLKKNCVLFVPVALPSPVHTSAAGTQRSVAAAGGVPPAEAGQRWSPARGCLGGGWGGCRAGWPAIRPRYLSSSNLILPSVGFP